MGATHAYDGTDRLLALEHEVEVLRTAARGQQTWVPPGHYYSPIPDPAQVRARADELFFRQRHTLPGIDLNFVRQEELLRIFLP